MNFKLKDIDVTVIVCVIAVLIFMTGVIYTDKYIPQQDEPEQAEENVEDEISEETVDAGLQEIEPVVEAAYVSEQGAPEGIVKPSEILDGEADSCGDINFDGYPDIKIYNREKKKSEYFLWDETEKQFVEAVVPDGFYFFFANELDDFKTFWDYNDSQDNEGQRQMTESLYQWEGTILEKIRRISCRFGEDEVTITLTDEKSGNVLKQELSRGKAGRSILRYGNYIHSFIKGMHRKNFIICSMTRLGRRK